jgi:hypothetical protein
MAGDKALVRWNKATAIYAPISTASREVVVSQLAGACGTLRFLGPPAFRRHRFGRLVRFDFDISLSEIQ